MTFRIISPDANGRIDPPVMRLLSGLPKSNNGMAIIPVTRLNDFVFQKPELRGESWALVDFSEFGWEWDQKSSYRWPGERLSHPWFNGEQWKQFAEFVSHCPPRVIFQRELLNDHVADRLIPIDYPNYSDEVSPESKEQFLARPIDVIHNWGRSHEDRVSLHAAIFQGSRTHGYPLVSDWSHMDRHTQENPRGTWAAIHTPHYARIDVRETIKWFGKSKIVISMPGCGVKTFRHGEINNAVMVVPVNRLCWTTLVPVRLAGSPWDFVGELLEMLDQENSLYDHYAKRVTAANWLRPESYLKHYVVPNIINRL